MDNTNDRDMLTKLRPPVFHPFALAEVRPSGWLRAQLQLQAEGLAGHLDLFWPDIRDSRWIGGEADGWERVPYWLDGLIPLAWLLEDEDLQRRASRYVGTILDNQLPDGWICPGEPGDRATYDMWALFLVLKVLTVWHDATGDPRVEPAVEKALRALDRHIDGHTLFGWAQTRWFECLIPLFWLFERTRADWLLHLAAKLKAQGFDWPALFACWPYEEPDEKGRWSQMSHVVNNAMMLKGGALSWRMGGGREAPAYARAMLAKLDAHHGMVTGVFTGDECLAGQSPIRGTELCAVAELMYSLEHLLAITGDPEWADRLERVAYNALPATFSPDMWSHQYDQQVNQVQCTVQPAPVFSTNGGDAHTFGVEPNFGCCTANMGQAWPKLAHHLFLRQMDGKGNTVGLALGVHAPGTLTTTVQRVPVRVTVKTEYPFRDTVAVSVQVETPVSFPLRIRVPGWAEEARLQMPEDDAMDGVPMSPGKFHVVERCWTGTTHFTCVFPMHAALVARPNRMAALERGPLVYAMQVGEHWRRMHDDLPFRELPHADWELIPTTEWNRAIDGDVLGNAAAVAALTFTERPVGDKPFSPDGAPVEVTVPVRRIDWPLENGSAMPVPPGTGIGTTSETARFIPYGCTNLRLTEMPVVRGTRLI